MDIPRTEPQQWCQKHEERGYEQFKSKINDSKSIKWDWG